MKTPETYIADRVQRVLTVLDQEDREALQIHIASEAASKAETLQKLSIVWRSIWGFSLLMAVLCPLSWYFANRPTPIELPSLPCPTCKACPKVTEPLPWEQLRSGNTWLPLDRAVSAKQECISFSNGTVTCIPRFQAPDKVETPAPETPK